MAAQAVFITGAGQGIGYALCRAFAVQGAQVALNDSDPSKAEAAATALNTELGMNQVHAYPGDIADTAGDIADTESLRSLINRFADQAGGLDVVIANAGITRYIPFLESEPTDFDRIVSVNLRGTYFTAQTAARRMIADGKAGRIILLSSVVGLRAFPNFSIYSMTKAAIAMMASSLALELGRHQITVNAISPGATLTERTLREDPNYEAGWSSVIPTGRVNYVEDVTAAWKMLQPPRCSWPPPLPGRSTGRTWWSMVVGRWRVRCRQSIRIFLNSRSMHNPC